MSLFKKMLFCILIILIRPTISTQQSHEISECTSEIVPPNPKSTCTSNDISCGTFIIYRAQKGFNTPSSIATLFSVSLFQIQFFNDLSPQSDHFPLRDDHEIMIPVWCSCSDSLFLSILNYDASHSDTLSGLACGTFEGLVKPRNLRFYNQGLEGDLFNGSLIQLPVTCSCPNSTDLEKGIKYLVAYPILENDDTDVIALKFGVTEQEVLDVNSLDPYDSIYPRTTLFVPTNDTRFLDHRDPTPSPDVASSPPIMIPPSGIVIRKGISNKYMYVMIGILVFVVILLIIMFLWTLTFTWIRKRKGSPGNGSGLTRFSKEFLDGMSKLKHSFTYFSLEELSNATGSFCEHSVIANKVYKGKIGVSYHAIKQVKSREEANSIICILAKINHLNVVKLAGFCDGTTPYLVFEFVENGSLRACLTNTDTAKQLTWKRRIQIASDIAEGLHYLHYCTNPTYLHKNINSETILVNANWRAKLSGFGSAEPLERNELSKEGDATKSLSVGREGCFAPEYIKYGQVSAKVDVYSYGVVLLKLLAGKEAIINSNHLKDFLVFSSTADSCGYLEKLEYFMDPLLEKDLPMTDVLYLAFLAKGCTEENPFKQTDNERCFESSFKDFVTTF